MRISDWSSDVCSSDRLGQARLGVAHRGSVIAVDVAEIALAVDQREAQREILRQAHQGVIDGLVAVRVELADHVADQPGGLLEPGLDRQRVVSGKIVSVRVDLGARRHINKKRRNSDSTKQKK